MKKKIFFSIYNCKVNIAGLLLLATCASSKPLLQNLASASAQNGSHNVSFVSNLLLGDVDKCLESLIRSVFLFILKWIVRTYDSSHTKNPYLAELFISFTR